MRRLLHTLTTATTLSTLVACGPSPPPAPTSSGSDPAPAPPTAPPAPPTPPAPPPAPPPTVPPAEPARDSPIGAWSSRECGPRRYERRVVLEAGGRLHGDERVSPCPPAVPCVWSGIVSWQGGWRVEGTRILITPDPDTARNPSATIPTELRWDAAAHAIVEAVGGVRCAYAPFPR